MLSDIDAPTKQALFVGLKDEFEKFMKRSEQKLALTSLAFENVLYITSY